MESTCYDFDLWSLKVFAFSTVLTIEFENQYCKIGEG